MTQEQLAAAASTQELPISQAAISALEKRDSETAAGLFAFARALRINPEWLQTGRGESGLDSPAWKPPSAELEPDESELLRDYRKSSDAWKLTMRLMGRTPPEEQPQLSRDMNILMTTIFGKATGDERLGDRWTRPDKAKNPKDPPTGKG
jgi:transcriptional regulator with XRE-family HTH domain